MIHEFHVQNYKALRDVKLKLTPMHVLIGPNDSGKTSILEALGALCRSVEMPLKQAFRGPWNGTELVTDHKTDLVVSLTVSGEATDRSRFSYALDVQFPENEARAVAVREDLESSSRTVNFAAHRDLTQVFRPDNGLPKHDLATCMAIQAALKNVHEYYWRPRELALPAAPDQSRYLRLERSGFGLAQLLDDVVGDDIRRYSEIEEKFCEVFPHVSRIAIHTTNAYRVRDRSKDEVEQLFEQDGRGIYFVLKRSDLKLRAAHASDGMLLVLAYLALRYSPLRPSVLLLEEPENGIHPERLKKVMNILRELVGEDEKTQVIMTTHSPYMVDLFQPDEITLCYKDEAGDVKTRSFAESPIVRKQMGFFTMGEIWTAEEDVIKAELPAEEAISEVQP